MLCFCKCNIIDYPYTTYFTIPVSLLAQSYTAPVTLSIIVLIKLTTWDHC